MKANNFSQTVAQIPNEWGITIPDSIDELSKDYYHILLVERVHNAEQQTYNTTFKVSAFPKSMWDKKKGSSREQLALLGYRNVFVLHDPNKKEEVKEVKKPAGRPKKKQTDFED